MTAETRHNSDRAVLYLVTHILVDELFSGAKEKANLVLLFLSLRDEDQQAESFICPRVECVEHLAVSPGASRIRVAHDHGLTAGNTQSQLGMTNWSETPPSTCQEMLREHATPNWHTQLSLDKLHTNRRKANIRRVHMCM